MKKNNYRTLIDVLKSLCESDYAEQIAPVYWLGAVEKYGEINTIFSSLNDTAAPKRPDISKNHVAIIKTGNFFHVVTYN